MNSLVLELLNANNTNSLTPLNYSLEPLNFFIQLLFMA